MKTGTAGRKLIESFEGLFLEAYDDLTEKVVKPGNHVYGTLTIGYGHTDAAGPPHVYPGMVITEEEADAILASDLSSVEANVNHHVKATLNQNQFDALVSFDFNTGGLDRSSVLRDVNSGHFNLVAGDLNLWIRSKGQILKGLIRRRKAEGELFNTPAGGEEV